MRLKRTKMNWANIKHQVVHKAILEHKSIIDTYITNPTSGTRNQNTITALEYAKLVCKELRGASCAMRDHKSVWIYREGDTHVMGWVGYGDWQTTLTPKMKYQFVMYAPFHENGKYREDNDQYRMSMFNDRDKAIKKAKALFRSYTVGESACALNSQAASSITDVQGNATKAYKDAGKPLDIHISSYGAGKHVLIDEFKALLASGHLFLRAEVGINMKKFCDAYDLFEKRKASEIPVMYVDMVTDRFGDKIYRLARLKNGRHYSPNPNNEVTSEEHCQQSDVPQWVVDRVSTLQIVDNETYVEGVGYKHCDNAYTIHVDEVNPFVD